ncbi:MAG: glycosyltransferase [Rhodanobacteraceae bacterium]
MRLLALTTSYPLHPGGCAGLFVQSLYRGLAAGSAIDVICPSDSKSVQATFDDSTGADIRVHAVRYAPQAWRTLAQESGGVVTSLRRAPWRMLLLPALLVALFWRCLRCAGSADLIHANWAVCGVVAGLVGRLRGKPVITTLRGSDVARAARSWLDRALLGLAVRNSRIVVCVSEAMAERMRTRFPHRTADIHACLNGVDDAFFQIDRTGSGSGVLQVLAVGNLIRLKGFDVLIKAVSRARHHERISVCLIGDGPERKPLQALAASLGVSSCFKFAGTIPTGEMPDRFSAADVFVLSSRSEGRPNVVVEALASGLPAVCTDLAGVKGMVKDGDNGWLVPVDDADALAGALDQATSNREELRRRGERSREIARTRIGTWADTARCYEAFFQTAWTRNGEAVPPCAE